MTEHQIQSAFFEWAAWNEGKHPELRFLFAVPNGGHRHIATAVKLKKEGVKPGVPDVWLPVPKGKHHGLVLEFKTDKGRPTVDQNWWLSNLAKHGFVCAVVRNLEEAIKETVHYLQFSSKRCPINYS